MKEMPQFVKDCIFAKLRQGKYRCDIDNRRCLKVRQCRFFETDEKVKLTMEIYKKIKFPYDSAGSKKGGNT